MLSVVMDIVDPQMHVLKENAVEHDCRLLEIKMENGDQLTLHFKDLEALKAFFGLGAYILSEGNGNDK